MRESVDRDSEGLQKVAERSIVEHALVAGSFDWVSEGKIRTIIRDESGITGDETLDAFTIGVVTILISEGYMNPTTYGEPWNLDPWDAVRKITERYLHPNRASPEVDDANMELTERGIVLAEAIAAREGWNPPPPGIYG